MKDSGKGKVRIIHFSDFHLDAEHEQDATSTVNHMLGRLAELNKEQQIDLALITGDLVNKGGQSYGGVHNALIRFDEVVMEPLCQVLGLERSRILFVPGNHEVDRGRVQDDEETVVKSIDLDNRERQDITGKIADFVSHSQGVKRLEDYKSFERNHLKSHLPADGFKYSAFQSIIKLQINGVTVGIDCVNSAWRCTGKEQFILFGLPQIDEALGEFYDCSLKIALAHHGLGWAERFEQRDLAKSLCGFDMFLCGHTHSQSSEETISSDGGRRYIITAPGLPQPLMYGHDEQFKTGFMLIDADIRGKKIVSSRYIRSPGGSYDLDLSYSPANGGYMTRFMSDATTQMSMKEFVSKWSGEKLYLDSIKYSHTVELIQERKSPLLISGPPGIGKTRLVVEIFRHNPELLDNAWYYESAGNDSAVQRNVLKTLENASSKPGYLILDNCEISMFTFAAATAKLRSKRFLVVGLTRSVDDQIKSVPKDCEQIELKSVVFKDSINEFLMTQIGRGGSSDTLVHRMSAYAEGFPYIAVKLAAQYRKACQSSEDGASRVFDVNMLNRELMKRIIDWDNLDENEQQAAQVLALFMPLPYNEPFPPALDAVVKMTSLCPLSNCTKLEDRREVFRKVIGCCRLGMGDDSIIEINNNNLMVRPLPVALGLIEILAEQIDRGRMRRIIEEFSNIDESVREMLVAGLSKRLECFHDNSRARNLLSRLCGQDSVFFTDGKVLGHQLSSRLFLAMASVNSEVAADRLTEILSGYDRAWLSDVDEETSNNLVLALRLMAHGDEYEKAVRMLAVMEACGGELLGSGARRAFCRLFQIFLSGTAVSLERSVKTLRELVQDSAADEDLVCAALDQALDIHAEPEVASGLMSRLYENNRELGITPQDAEDYWRKCLDVLEDIAKKSPQGMNKAARVLERCLVRDNLVDLAPELLDLTAGLETLGAWRDSSDHYALYEGLKKLDEDRAQLDEAHGRILETFLEKYKPQSFWYRLQKVQSDLYGKVHEDFDEFRKQISEVMAKEAQCFVEQEVYKDKRQLSELLKSDQFDMRDFLGALAQRLTKQKATELLDTAEQIIVEIVGGGDRAGYDYYSQFLFYLCSLWKDKDHADNFYKRLYADGFHLLYIKLMCSVEDDQLRSWQALSSKSDLRLSEGRDLKEIYLYFLGVVDRATFAQVVEQFKDCRDDLVRFVWREIQHEGALYADRTLLQIWKGALLSYNLQHSSSLDIYHYNESVLRCLQSARDEDFAGRVFSELSAYYEGGLGKGDCSKVYAKLLDEYWSPCGEKLLCELTAPKKGFLVYNLNKLIGSGWDKVRGALFSGHDEEVKKACLNDSSGSLAARIAYMLPPYNDDLQHDHGAVTGFSTWLMWMLDNFGNNDRVLDALSANLNSFQWSGSPEGMHTVQIKCLEHIKSHPSATVREWALSEIDKQQKMIEYWNSRETFMRIQGEEV